MRLSLSLPGWSRRWLFRPLVLWLFCRLGILPALRYVWHCVASSNVEVRGRQGSRASRLLEGCSEVHRRVAPPLILGGIFQTVLLAFWMVDAASTQLPAGDHSHPEKKETRKSDVLPGHHTGGSGLA